MYKKEKNKKLTKEKLVQVKKKNNGITLIALVVTIIVLLILAGLAINLSIGQNGIITRAQNAKMVTAVSSFNEYMQMWYASKKIEDKDYNIEKLYVSSGWLDRKIETDESGNAYYVYIIDKSKVTDKDMLSHMENGKGDPYLLQDVYGINPDFTIWYRDKNGNLIASSVSVVPIDDSTEVKFANPALSKAIANSVGQDKENYTIGDLKNVTTLKLNYDGTDTDIKNLDDLYYLPSLANLYVYNLELDNVDGLKYCKKINEIYFSGCMINDFNGLKYSTSLRNLSIVTCEITNDNVQNVFESIKNISTLYKLNISNSTTELTNIKSINNGLQSLVAKSTIKQLILSNNYLKGELNLQNFTSLSYFDISYCRYITGILGLEEITGLTYFNATNNSLEDISNLRMSSASNVQNYIYLKDNSTLKPDSIKAISQQLLNATEYTIDYQLAQYIEGNKVLDYSSSNLNDGDIYNIPDSVENLNLYNNNNLTNIEFLKNKTNIKVLNISNCNNIDGTNLIDTLSTLSGLERLIIDNMQPLNTIKFIKNMPNLKYLSMTNTNVEITSKDDEDAIALNESNIQELHIGINNDNTYKSNNINLTYIQQCISNLTGDNGLMIYSTEEGYKQFAKQLSQCTDITRLRMRFSNFKGVEEIDLTKCTKLKNIEIYSLSSNLIIKGLANLESLQLQNMNDGNNYYKMPDVSGCNKLNNITFTGNFMTDTDLKNMCSQLNNSSVVTTLNLDNNSISDITCLANLKALKSLALNNNNISNLNGIEELKNLTSIYLRYNNLNTEDLSSLVNLYNKYQKIRNIYLYGNNIDDYSSIYDFANRSVIEQP